MALLPPRPFNRGGTWGIESIGAPEVKTTEGEVIFKFAAHPFVNAPYNGELIVHITAEIPSTAAGTEKVYFKTGNEAQKAVTRAGGDPLVAADIATTGYYKFFYDYTTGVLEAMASIVPSTE